MRFDYLFTSTLLCLMVHMLLFFLMDRSILFFVFASNLLGIFIAASFEAMRICANHENANRLLSGSAAVPASDGALPSSPDSNMNKKADGGQLFNLNFNLPLFGHHHSEQAAISSSPYLRVVDAGSQLLSDTFCRRRIQPNPLSGAMAAAGGCAEQRCGEKSSLTLASTAAIVKSLIFKPLWKLTKATAIRAAWMTYWPIGKATAVIRKLGARAWSSLKASRVSSKPQSKKASRAGFEASSLSSPRGQLAKRRLNSTDGSSSNTNSSSLTKKPEEARRVRVLFSTSLLCCETNFKAYPQSCCVPLYCRTRSRHPGRQMVIYLKNGRRATHMQAVIHQSTYPHPLLLFLFRHSVGVTQQCLV